MAGREVREYTNLSDPKDKKSGKGKDKIDDEDITFQRMVAKMQEVAGERGGYLHGRGALDSDDLLYLKEQMEAEEDAERLLRRTEKRAFAAFKKAANLADSSLASVPLPLRVEAKPKSGIRQQALLKKVVEIKPKRQRVSNSSDGKQPTLVSSDDSQMNQKTENDQLKEQEQSLSGSNKLEEQSLLLLHKAGESTVENSSKSLLGLAYVTSDEEDEE
ncbi:Ankyrin repeat protein [Quillaja saponaria]|uniref:Ankyrin repeat protein n=1 Tax=Quillaja saponaria TaxID=32244 RepID=A0AAD7Q613_QUISA|nr:Ankyrin repeat protein [Quillaja saponaria]